MSRPVSIVQKRAVRPKILEAEEACKCADTAFSVREGMCRLCAAINTMHRGKVAIAKRVEIETRLEVNIGTEGLRLWTGCA